MNRKLMLAVTIGAMFVAAGAFAQVQAEFRSEGGPDMSASGGGAAVVAPNVQAPAPANLVAVSGEVVLMNPAEVIIRTQKGLETFELTPQTVLRAGADGQDVTIFYVPPQTAASRAADQKVGMSTDKPAKAELVAWAVTPLVPSTLLSR